VSHPRAKNSWLGENDSALTLQFSVDLDLTACTGKGCGSGCSAYRRGQRSRQWCPGSQALSSRDNAAGKWEAAWITLSSFSYLSLTWRETNAYRIVVAEQPDDRWQIALL
jgi:hypothetical protein